MALYLIILYILQYMHVHRQCYVCMVLVKEHEAICNIFELLSAKDTHYTFTVCLWICVDSILLHFAEHAMIQQMWPHFHCKSAAI